VLKQLENNRENQAMALKKKRKKKERKETKGKRSHARRSGGVAVQALSFKA
jgi:hypothetical protein